MLSHTKGSNRSRHGHACRGHLSATYTAVDKHEITFALIRRLNGTEVMGAAESPLILAGPSLKTSWLIWEKSPLVTHWSGYM